MDVEEFKREHPEYMDEPYFIRQCGKIRFVNECQNRCTAGKHIKTGSSESRGTLGFAMSNASNNASSTRVRGVTAFHVLHPECEQSDGIEKTYNTCKEAIDEYNSKKGNHFLSDVPYYVNDEETRWSFSGGIYNAHFDVGVVETHEKSVPWIDTYDFEWPSILKEIRQKDFHKLFLNYSINKSKPFIVYHNGVVSDVTRYGELDTLQNKTEEFFSANTGEPAFLEDHACVTTVKPMELKFYCKQISMGDLIKYAPNDSSLDSDDSESEGEEQPNHNTNDDSDDDDGNDDVKQLDNNDNLAERFTSPGDSGGIYYVKIKGTDKVYKAPIAIHRCNREDKNGYTSYGSRIDKLVWSSFGEDYTIKF